VRISGYHMRNKKLSYPWQTTNRATRLEVIKVTKHGTITYVRYGFLLVRYNNFFRKTHHFLDIRLQKCRDLENLENRVRGPSRSLKMSPLDRQPMTSYGCSITAQHCYNGDVSFLWEKMETLTPCKIQTLEQIDTQFVRIDYVHERNVCSKFGKNPFCATFYLFIYLFIYLIFFLGPT